MHDSETSRRWPGYGAVWRWHFYAGLFCIPFILWLAITGSFYLFRPQIEALIDRPYSNVATGGPQASATAQVAAAVRAVPGSVLHRYQLPDTDEQAVQIIVGRDMRETRVYVHPQTVAVLKTVDEDSRLMPLVSRLHGELLIGDKGSFIVELAASWAIVMIVSGLFLWWPRGTGLAGIVYPRLGADGRRFWRDVHAVTGLWVSLFALAFLLSGLPWAKSWGSYLKAARSVAAVATIPQDWPVSHSEELKGRAATDGATRAMLGEHAEHMGMTMEQPALSYAPIDRLVAGVRPLGLAAPVLIAPPTGAGALWTAKSDAADRPLRTNLTLDGATGYILSRQDFRGRPIIDRIVGYGVAAHEGQLFGVANQLLNLALAHGLTTLAVSGAVMWWRRKPEDALGAPPVRSWPPLAIGFIGLLVLLGVLLPMLGVSMIVVLLVERLVLRHLPGPGRWLGLSPAPAVPSPGIDR